VRDRQADATTKNMWRKGKEQASDEM